MVAQCQVSMVTMQEVQHCQQQYIWTMQEELQVETNYIFTFFPNFNFKYPSQLKYGLMNASPVQ